MSYVANTCPSYWISDMPHAEPPQTAPDRIGGRRETMTQTIMRMSAGMDAWDARPKRRKLTRPAAEFDPPSRHRQNLPT